MCKSILPWNGKGLEENKKKSDVAGCLEGADMLEHDFVTAAVEQAQSSKCISANQFSSSFP